MATRKLSVFERLEGGGGGGGQFVKKQQVCVYWLQGRCNRNPCRFMHRLNPQSEIGFDNQKFKSTWKNPNSYQSKNAIKKCSEGTRIDPDAKKRSSICEYWLTDNCVHGDNCKDLHSYSSGSGLSMLSILDGHTKAVTGIALPSGSDKLYSGSEDGSIRMWDCHSGQCVGVVKLDSEVCCLISEGHWLFAGLQNAVKVWNLQHQTEFLLNGIVGRVCSMVVSDDMLFAGVEGGMIFAWKFYSDQCEPQLVGALKGHDDDVVALVVGCNNRLYSGSKDHTVKAWDCQNMQCLHTLHGHSSAVTSVLCWDRYLLSGSLDNTLKVWEQTNSGTLEVVFEYREQTGILSLCGMMDAEEKPILLYSCNGNCTKLIELPSLSERGRAFAKRDIRSVQIGCGGLFFSGDEAGKVYVWKLNEAKEMTTSIR